MYVKFPLINLLQFARFVVKKSETPLLLYSENKQFTVIKSSHLDKFHDTKISKLIPVLIRIW